MKKRTIAERIDDLNDYLMLQKHYYYNLNSHKIENPVYDKAEVVLEKLLKKYPQYTPKYDVTKQVDAPPPGWMDKYNMKQEAHFRKMGIDFIEMGTISKANRKKGRKKK